MAPRTAREALILEMMGDIDGVLARVEALPARIAAVEERLAASTSVLDAAGERYRMTLVAFTEQAKTQITSYLERKAGETSTKMLESQRQELQAAVLRTLDAIAERDGLQRRAFWPRIGELMGVSILTALCTAGLLVWLR